MRDVAKQVGADLFSGKLCTKIGFFHPGHEFPGKDFLESSDDLARMYSLDPSQKRASVVAIHLLADVRIPSRDFAAGPAGTSASSNLVHDKVAVSSNYRRITVVNTLRNN